MCPFFFFFLFSLLHFPGNHALKTTSTLSRNNLYLFKYKRLFFELKKKIFHGFNLKTKLFLSLWFNFKKKFSYVKKKCLQKKFTLITESFVTPFGFCFPIFFFLFTIIQEDNYFYRLFFLRIRNISIYNLQSHECI